MPYKVALFDQERSRELKRLGVALHRQRRALAKSIKERDRWAHDLANHRETLTFTLDHARYASCEKYIALAEVMVLVHDTLLLVHREVITATEELRQTALAASHYFSAGKRYQAGYFDVLKKLVAPDKLLAYRELMTRLNEELQAAIRESPTSLRTRRATTKLVTAHNDFVARESIAEDEFDALIAAREDELRESRRRERIWFAKKSGSPRPVADGLAQRVAELRRAIALIATNS